MRGACILVACLAIGAARIAHADDWATWYVGAGAGQSEGRHYCDAQAGVTVQDCSDTGAAWRLFLGYQINRYLGVEGGYLDLGRFSAEASGAGAPGSTYMKARAGYLEGVATLPIGSRFGLFAKAGGLYWSLKGSAAIDRPIFEGESNNGVDFIGGAGAQVFITPHLALRAEYEWIPKLGNSDSGEVTVQVVSASILWKF